PQLLLPMLCCCCCCFPVCLRQGGAVAAFRVEAEADYPDSDLAGIDDLLVKKRLAAADHSNLDSLKFPPDRGGESCPAAARTRMWRDNVQADCADGTAEASDKQTAPWHSKRL
uniref:INCENP_ARK-bind domain-containing protein n=1 Tax=Macrostomum lignano TaxID=282301 RepID=A0A1I8F7X8_9PLAT